MKRRGCQNRRTGEEQETGRGGGMVRMKRPTEKEDW